jgi:hypothetical protein
MERNDSNARAVKVLGLLLISVAGIFAIETKFLVPTVRGETLIQYESLSWNQNILLLVDDFEELKGDSASLAKEKFFSYGSVKITTDNSIEDKSLLSSKTAMKVSWAGNEMYGGWGKGVGKNVNLDPATDHLNFRIYIPESNGNDEIVKVIFEEDDNNDGSLQQDKDDSWQHVVNIPKKNGWQMISIPLKDFTDGNPGGDGQLNVSRKGGLHNLIFSFEQAAKYTPQHCWYFDFISFSNKKIDNL